jgi:hypothetical protein
VFHGAFARLGLGLGWSVGFSMVFGTASNTALAGSMASLALLVLANLALAYPLPSHARFLRLGANLDSPAARANMALWFSTVLLAACTLFLLAAPSSWWMIRVLLGLDALALLPATMALGAGPEWACPRPRWKTPFLPFYYDFSGLASGALVYASYGFILNGAASVAASPTRRSSPPLSSAR